MEVPSITFLSVHSLKCHLILWVVIFEQPFETTFDDNFFFLSFHWLKTMERKKEYKRVMWVWERKFVKKLLQNGCTNIISLILFIF